VVVESHSPDDLGELLEFRLLGREEWISFEEGDHTLDERSAIPDDEHEGSVASAVRLDVATTQLLSDQVEHLSSVAILADVELGNELKSDAAGSIALHQDREAPFSVVVTRDVAVQPFLLIVRTRHVVTIVNVRPDVTMSSARCSEFPALGRIYRQQWSTVSRRSEPSSRTALMGEQPNPWDLLQPQDATSRHRGAKPFRRCGLLGRISLLSPEYLLSVERRHFHSLPPDH
jgi:hypothetical protein